MSTPNDNDLFLVERSGVQYQLSYSDMSTLNDDDLLLVERSGTQYKIKAEDMNFGVDNPIAPALPPFAGRTTTETVLSSADGKVEFSLDGSTYTTSLTVPAETFYYVDWGTDILSASHGSSYSASVGASYTDLNVSSTNSFDINSIDKLPDSFSFDAIASVAPGSDQFSSSASPLQTINAPTSLWVTSDATTFQVRIGQGAWFNPPALPGSAYVTAFEEIQLRHEAGPLAETDYTTTLNVGYGTGSGEFESADFVTTTGSIFVSKPSITSPISGETVDTQAISVTTSAFAGQFSGTHASTDWQIASDANFTTLLAESLGDTSNLTTWTPTLSSLLDATLYVRSRHTSSDGIVSPYSDAVSFEGEFQFVFSMESLVIAGGGAHELFWSVGVIGGGAGGYISTVAGEQTGGNTSSLTPIGVSYSSPTASITVGAAGQDSSLASNGTTFTAIKGGRYGIASGSGGSGAGAQAANNPSSPGTGTSGQGFDGGTADSGMHTACGSSHTCHSLCGPFSKSGGGGGAGSAASGSDAGDGIASSITGTSVTYAGGGAGRGTCSNPGEDYSGDPGDPGNGHDNYGGGGGCDGTFTNIASAQPGAVILRFPDTFSLTSTSGDLVISTSSVGNDTVATLTSGSGVVTFSAVSIKASNNMTSQIPDYILKGHRAPTSKAWRLNNVPAPAKPTK